MTTGSTILDVPRQVRDNIYKRLLVLGHPLFIFQDSVSSPIESFAPDKPPRWLALLLVNRQVNDEARKVLYDMNHFILVDTSLDEVHLLCSFLDGIGSTNASLLSHLRINFPALEQPQPDQPPRGKLTLTQGGLQSVTLLRDQCASLTSLEMLVHTQSSRALVLAGDNDLQSVRDALLPIDAQLKAIPSLTKIIVRFHTEHPADLVVALIQGLGWEVYFGEGSLQSVQVIERIG